MNVEDALAEQINLRKLLASADFQEENVLRAAMEQPKLYLQAVTLKVNANRHKIKMETRFELIKSELSKDIRANRSVKTEGHLKEILMRRKSYRKAKYKFDEAKDHEEYMEKLCRMFEMRMQSIRVVAQLMGAEQGSISRKESERIAQKERDHMRHKAEQKYGRS